MSEHKQRAELLLEQSRFDLAEKELRQALLADPNDAHAHALLGLTLSEQEKFEEATGEAKAAIHLRPDADFAHFVLARVLFQRDRYAEALPPIQEAIRIDPFNANYHGLLAGIRFSQRRWTDALAAAEAGLEINPEDGTCANLRAMALVKLGRRQEAGHTLEASLTKNPDNADTHAGQGWALLDASEPRKAMEHFREALRLDPTSEFARAGIVEALKAHNPVYRMMLGYFLWMGKLSGAAQWGILIGAYVASRFVRGFAKANPEWAPFLWPLLGLYFVFVVLTWLAVPLFNLLLRLNRFGRLALSREQVVASNWVGACLLGGIAAALAGWLLDRPPLLGFGAVLLLLLFPLAGTFMCDAGWPRNAMAIYTVALFALGVLAVGLLAMDIEQGTIAAGLFAIGVFASSFVANGLAQVTPKR